MNSQIEQSMLPGRRPRRWRTINQVAEQSGAVFTEAAIRALVYRAKPHFDSKGDWVTGNGLASHICQPGGKGGKVLIDENGWDEWLESWCVNVGQRAA